jgi:hypothetical protein
VGGYTKCLPSETIAWTGVVMCDDHDRHGRVVGNRRTAVKPQVLVGIALALVMVAAGVLVSALRSTEAVDAEAALEQATLARRQLARSSLVLPLVTPLVGLDGLSGEALEAAVAGAQDELEELRGTYAEELGRLQRQAAEHGLSLEGATPLAPTASGVQVAVREFNEAAAANEQLLAATLKNAREAVSTDREALGVAQVQGMAEYAQAVILALESKRLRMEQRAAQARLLKTAAEWKETRGYLDHYRALDAEPVRAQLEADLADIASRRAEADETLAALEAQVAEQGRMLSGAEAGLAEATQALRDLEAGGFEAGNDAAFEAYRAQYRALAQRVAQLDQRVQELRYGGRRGAVLVGDDPQAATLQGGEAIVGLERLERERANAEDRARRLRRANESLDQQMGFLDDAGTRADEMQTHYRAQLAALEADLKQIYEESIDQLVAEATAKESEALQLAQRSVQSFGQATRAAESYVRAVRQLQSEQDPEQQNERLQLILQDKTFEQSPRSAEAAARLLMGRVQAQRISALEALRADLLLLGEIRPGAPLPPADIQTQIDDARTAGMENLEQAATLYSSVADRLASENTQWVPLAGLAAVHHLMSRVDDAGQAAAHLADALDFIRQAVAEREQFPYAAAYVDFRDHLSGAGPSVAPAPAGEEFFLDETEPSDETTEEGAEESGGGDDFFLEE